MRFLNIIAALIVLVCNIVVSYNHSIALFESGGFSGWMAHVAVIAAEITFIMGAFNIVVARMHGEHPGAPAIFGGLLGIAVVGWSNIAAGWSHGVVGIILGAVTPLSLIIAEAILSRAALQGTTTEVVEPLEEQEVEVEDEQPLSEPIELPAAEQEPATTLMEIARKIYLEDGQLPGRVRLSKEAGCSDWEARKVLGELKGMTQNA